MLCKKCLYLLYTFCLVVRQRSYGEVKDYFTHVHGSLLIVTVQESFTLVNQSERYCKQ